MSDTSAEQAAAWNERANVVAMRISDGYAPVARAGFELRAAIFRAAKDACVEGFEAGARWQRERPVTEAEVLVALITYYNEQHESKITGVTFSTADFGELDYCEMRAALEAARRVGDGEDAGP